jgi:prefoldin subunit 5
MANEELLISGIEYKVRKLVENLQLLQAENEKLRKELQVREQMLSELRESLDIKNNEFLKLSLANALENKYGVEKGIQIIDQLIEEIDRSIDVISE